MTTIIGVQHSWGCSVHTDGQTTHGDYRRYASRLMSKAVERGSYLIAASGSGAACDAAMYSWEPPLPPAGVDAAAMYQFMITDVVPSIREALEGIGYMMDEEEKHTLELLIAVQGELFQVASDGTVMRHHRGTYGIGSGSGYAIGALAAGASPSLAIQIAADNDTYTAEPFFHWKQAKPGQEIL